MNKQDVIEFFDRCAPSWDAELIKSDEIIGKILSQICLKRSFAHFKMH